MGSKPSDFLIGIAEFIGVLLPGAVLAWMVSPALASLAARNALPIPSGSGGWVALAILAYLGGHLVFLVGSYLDTPYDLVRRQLRPREGDVAYQAATALAKRELGDRFAALNTYKFATALLALAHPVAYGEVKQLEADSKFFRSLVVLALGWAVLGIAKSDGPVVVGALALATPCALRFGERRWKSTQRAYEYVVVLLGAPGLAAASGAAAATHREPR